MICSTKTPCVFQGWAIRRCDKGCDRWIWHFECAKSGHIRLWFVDLDAQLHKVDPSCIHHVGKQGYLKSHPDCLVQDMGNHGKPMKYRNIPQLCNCSVTAWSVFFIASVNIARTSLFPHIYRHKFTPQTKMEDLEDTKNDFQRPQFDSQCFGKPLSRHLPVSTCFNNKRLAHRHVGPWHIQCRVHWVHRVHQRQRWASWPSGQLRCQNRLPKTSSRLDLSP